MVRRAGLRPSPDELSLLEVIHDLTATQIDALYTIDGMSDQPPPIVFDPEASYPDWRS
jgi:hypothetical protein